VTLEQLSHPCQPVRREATSGHLSPPPVVRAQVTGRVPARGYRRAALCRQSSAL